MRYTEDGILEKKVLCHNANPVALYQGAKKMINGTGFSSVGGFVTYVLRELISTYEDSKLNFTEEDKERIKRKLKALGYFD